MSSNIRKNYVFFFIVLASIWFSTKHYKSFSTEGIFLEKNADWVVWKQFSRDGNG